jgi:hypothetical protein
MTTAEMPACLLYQKDCTIREQQIAIRFLRGECQRLEEELATARGMVTDLMVETWK